MFGLLRILFFLRGYRSGGSTGAVGEISGLGPIKGEQRRPYRTARPRRRVSWLGDLDQEEVTKKMQRTVSFCSSSSTQLTAAAFAAAAAAATGATLTTVAFYPVELVKNRLQSATSDGSGDGFRYNGLADGLLTVLREEGVAGLFTGLRFVLARALASDFATVYFGELFIARWGSGQGPAELPLRVVGGWVSVALTLPLEIISTRITCTRPPLSALAATKKLWLQGGLGAFWQGFRVMLVLCLNPALTFTAFGWLRNVFLALRRRFPSRQSNGQLSTASGLQWWEAFLVGMLAKMATLVTVYPLIRAKFVLQALNFPVAPSSVVTHSSIEAQKNKASKH